MDTIDPMVSALIALCKSEGGEKFVADKAKVSAENLTQITKGVKLPSGNPRGVGPGIRAKLTAAYPGWLSTAALSPQSGVVPADYKQKPPIAQVQQAQDAITLDDAVRVVAEHLMPLDATALRRASVLLADLGSDPSQYASLAVLLAQVIHSGKRKAA